MQSENSEIQLDEIALQKVQESQVGMTGYPEPTSPLSAEEGSGATRMPTSPLTVIPYLSFGIIPSIHTPLITLSDDTFLYYIGRYIVRHNFKTTICDYIPVPNDCATVLTLSLSSSQRHLAVGMRDTAGNCCVAIYNVVNCYFVRKIEVSETLTVSKIILNLSFSGDDSSLLCQTGAPDFAWIIWSPWLPTCEQLTEHSTETPQQIAQRAARAVAQAAKSPVHSDVTRVGKTVKFTYLNRYDASSALSVGPMTITLWRFVEGVAHSFPPQHSRRVQSSLVAGCWVSQHVAAIVPERSGEVVIISQGDVIGSIPPQVIWGSSKVGRYLSGSSSQDMPQLQTITCITPFNSGFIIGTSDGRIVIFVDRRTFVTLRRAALRQFVSMLGTSSSAGVDMGLFGNTDPFGSVSALVVAESEGAPLTPDESATEAENVIYVASTMPYVPFIQTTVPKSMPIVHLSVSPTSNTLGVLAGRQVWTFPLSDLAGLAAEQLGEMVKRQQGGKDTLVSEPQTPTAVDVPERLQAQAVQQITEARRIGGTRPHVYETSVSTGNIDDISLYVHDDSQRKFLPQGLLLPNTHFSSLSHPCSFPSEEIVAVAAAECRPIATFLTRHTIRVFNIQTGSLMSEVRVERQNLSAAIHPSGLHLVVGMADGLSFYHILTDTISFYNEITSLRDVRTLAIAPHGGFVAAASGLVCYVFDFYSLRLIRRIDKHVRQITDISWDSTGFRLTTVGLDGYTFTWDIGTGRREVEVAERGVSHLSCALYVQSFAPGKDNTGVITTGSIEQPQLDTINVVSSLDGTLRVIRDNMVFHSYRMDQQMAHMELWPRPFQAASPSAVYAASAAQILDNEHQALMRDIEVSGSDPYYKPGHEPVALIGYSQVGRMGCLLQWEYPPRKSALQATQIHQRSITCMSTMRQDILITGSEDGVVLVSRLVPRSQPQELTPIECRRIASPNAPLIGCLVSQVSVQQRDTLLLDLSETLDEMRHFYSDAQHRHSEAHAEQLRQMTEQIEAMAQHFAEVERDLKRRLLETSRQAAVDRDEVSHVMAARLDALEQRRLDDVARVSEQLNEAARARDDVKQQLAEEARRRELSESALGDRAQAEIQSLRDQMEQQRVRMEAEKREIERSYRAQLQVQGQEYEEMLHQVEDRLRQSLASEQQRSGELRGQLSLLRGSTRELQRQLESTVQEKHQLEHELDHRQTQVDFSQQIASELRGKLAECEIAIGTKEQQLNAERVEQMRGESRRALLMDRIEVLGRGQADRDSAIQQLRGQVAELDYGLELRENSEAARDRADWDRRQAMAQLQRDLNAAVSDNQALARIMQSTVGSLCHISEEPGILLTPRGAPTRKLLVELRQRIEKALAIREKANRDEAYEAVSAAVDLAMEDQASETHKRREEARRRAHLQQTAARAEAIAASANLQCASTTRRLTSENASLLTSLNELRQQYSQLQQTAAQRQNDLSAAKLLLRRYNSSDSRGASAPPQSLPLLSTQAGDSSVSSPVHPMSRSSQRGASQMSERDLRSQNNSSAAMRQPVSTHFSQGTG